MTEPIDEWPARAIERIRASLATLSDRELLASIRAAEPPRELDESDPIWTTNAAWHPLHQVVAFAEEIGRRRLVAGIAPLYELAPVEDVFEMMQAIRHGPERAATDAELVEIMLSLVGHARPGTRRWASRELGILRERTTVDPLKALALNDPVAEVRMEACMSLVMLTQRHPDLGETVKDVLLQVATHDGSREVRYDAADDLADLDPVLALPLQRSVIRQEWFMDPEWSGDSSGLDAYQAVRRIIRALVTGALRHPRLDAYLRDTGRSLVMTPGSGVYPPREPDKPVDGTAPTWEAHILLWALAVGDDERSPSGLVADIEIRRASEEEVRARLRAVVDA